MSKSAIRTIGITLGDPQGIGPEVIRKALLSPRLSKKCSFLIIGNHPQLRGLRIPKLNIPYKNPGEGSLKFLDHGITLIKGGIIDALVTAPLSKERVNQYHKGFRGHTEYLADAFGVKRFDMMFISKHMRLSLLTRHVPLKDVPNMVTSRAVLNAIELLHETLKVQFGIAHPRIAVLGLNPHAGEGGLLGKEEQRSIIPAIRKTAQNGMKVYGPFPADTFFIKECLYDGVIAMYHDQGLAPVKGKYFQDLVNFTAGLPFIRTSPVHGTAFDIAGKNRADPASMIAAINLACDLT